ncbi:MAG: exodeoxyribonuclease VII large subunit [Chloroflexota bacterium]
MPEIYPIAEITAHIRYLLETDTVLQDVWVQGEVSNMKRAASGHWYFTLKDSASQLRCVMWRSDASRQLVVPENGDSIIVHGRVSVYDQRGDYQLHADFIRAAGVGDLYAQFEQLKMKLDAEGLFAAEHKKPLPVFPLRIGVVTSPDAAGYQDVLDVLRRRFPLADVTLSPTLVQGAEAPPLIADAIHRLDASGKVDVILVVRGGGSIEDLWAFNDEQVARAAFEAVTPLVSGVGHETDFTIIDFVADQRAPTPSAAAELVSPDVADIHADLLESKSLLQQLAQRHITALRDNIQQQQKTLHYLSPSNAVRNHRQRVDDLNTRLIVLQAQHMAQLRERLSGKSAALESTNPEAILKRGYTIVRDSASGNIVQSVQAASQSDALTLTFADGDINATPEE